jgi:hypothetical protein
VNTRSDCHPHDAHISDSQKPTGRRQTRRSSHSIRLAPWALLRFAVLAAPDQFGEGPDDLTGRLDHDVRIAVVLLQGGDHVRLAGRILRHRRWGASARPGRSDGLFDAGVVANVVVPTPEYVRFATHYGFRPDFCEAADPESKGMVEHLVGYAKRDVIPPQAPFDDLAAGNAAAGSPRQMKKTSPRFVERPTLEP